MENQNDDHLLASYFAGKLTQAEIKAVENWRDASEENRLIFRHAEKVWRSLDLLQEMKQYKTDFALRKVNAKIGQATVKGQKGFLFYWQRVAAILLLPILILGGYYFFRNTGVENNTIVWQTITTPPGVKSQAQLPDGTKVWLNSESKLSYPSSFTRHERNIKLEGEAYFEVAKDKRHPFYVDLEKIGIEVTGTTFNVINYKEERQTEVILTSGKVKLLEQKENKRIGITEMEPGQKAVYGGSADKISLQRIDTEKYVSWIYGRLIFRDDPMTEVIRRLNRWFNVDIEIADPGIAQYIYTATFQEETIEQILNLLKRTSPIQYTIIPAQRLDDGSFGKQKIILNKR
jgi:ferric-dicitrate binding protein FerR (iron transport regulator)